MDDKTVCPTCGTPIQQDVGGVSPAVALLRKEASRRAHDIALVRMGYELPDAGDTPFASIFLAKEKERDIALLDTLRRKLGDTTQPCAHWAIDGTCNCGGAAEIGKETVWRTWSTT